MKIISVEVVKIEGDTHSSVGVAGRSAVIVFSDVTIEIRLFNVVIYRKKKRVIEE